MKRKILVSPGFGAGWTTWNSGETAKYMLTYQPVIDALENGEELTDSHPAIEQLKEDCRLMFGEEYVCVLGMRDLEVVEVSGRVRIHEYDGSESYEEEGHYDGWM